MSTIPTKWKVRITEENREVLEQWRIKQPGVMADPKITCLVYRSLNHWLVSDRYDGSYLHWGDAPQWKEITYEEFKQFVLMENKFAPIAMKCNQEQFDAIKPILEEHGMEISEIDSFVYYSYLTNNYCGDERTISNIANSDKKFNNRTSYEQWNQDTFLKACGIETNQNTKMKTYNIKISDLKKIHDVACNKWQSKIKALITDPFAESIELTQTQVDEMFKAAQDHQRPVLVEVFGEPTPKHNFKEGQLLWVWSTNTNYPNVRKFVRIEDSLFECANVDDIGTCCWDNAAPFNNGILPDNFKHLLNNQ